MPSFQALISNLLVAKVFCLEIVVFFCLQGEFFAFKLEFSIAVSIRAGFNNVWLQILHFRNSRYLWRMLVCLRKAFFFFIKSGLSNGRWWWNGDSKCGGVTVHSLIALLGEITTGLDEFAAVVYPEFSINTCSVGEQWPCYIYYILVSPCLLIICEY